MRLKIDNFKKFLVIFILLISSALSAQMVLIYELTEDNTDVVLPLRGDVDVNIVWEVGSNGEDVNGAQNKSHTYTTAGEKTIIIDGSMTAYGNSNISVVESNKNLIKVTSWEGLGITNFNAAFYSASKLVAVPDDLPSGVITMNNMFHGASSFNQDIRNWDVSNVTDMSGMFRSAIAFNQDIGAWRDKVSNVTDMSIMFRSATAFNQDIGDWDVSSVVDMGSMFRGAIAFNQDIGKWDVSSVTVMGNMFNGAIVFNKNISNWDVSSVVRMNEMFEGAIAFNQDIGGWKDKVGKVTNMTKMFFGASSFNQDIGNWDVSNVTDMSSMFRSAKAFNQDIGGWKVDSVINMGNMFQHANVFNNNGNDLNEWNVSNVTNMFAMFEGTPFDQDIGGWDVSNVTNMGNMFQTAETFNQDIGNWKVDSVITMGNMFYGATAFNNNNTDGLNKWNVSNVTNMGSMFRISAFNQDIGDWDVSNVEDMGHMFQNAISFNQDIGDWKVNKVKKMYAMFNGTPFDHDIGGWKVDSVTDMRLMFKGNKSFDQDIGDWNVSKVTEMNEMFQDATAFNQDIGGWDIGNVTDMSLMFKGTQLCTDNYDKLLIGWSQQDVDTLTFHGGNSTYSIGTTAKEALEAKGWLITDGGEDIDGSNACLVGLPFDRDSICEGEQVSISYGLLNYSSNSSFELKVEDSLYITGSDIVHTFTTTGFVEVLLTVKDDTGLDITIIDSVYVQGSADLLTYDVLYTSNLGTTDHIVGQENIVYSCGEVNAFFSSTKDLVVHWDGIDMGNEYIITAKDTLYFDVWDQYGLCSTRDSVMVEYNSTTTSGIEFQLNTSNTSDQVYVRWDDFQQIESATINEEKTTLLDGSTVRIITEVDDKGVLEFIVEYSVNDNVTGTQEIIVNLQDACGAIKEVFYVFDLQYEEPLLTDTVTIELTGNSEDKDSTFIALNTNITKEITILNEELHAAFLEVSIDSSDVQTGIRIAARDEFTDFIGEDTIIYVNYKICEIVNNVKIACEVPERIAVRLVKNIFVETIDLVGGVLDAQGQVLTNKQIRDSIEIIVTNSAVTDDVGLSFEFRWNGELINPDSLQYELTIVSRWNDVVYQETGSGQYPHWNGDNKPLTSSRDLTNIAGGNYFWMMRVDFINENGNEKKYYRHGYLYYRPIKTE